MSTLSCPQRSLPVTVIDRFTLNSTDGEIEHVRISCPASHHFLMALDQLTETIRAVEAQPLTKATASVR
ncbi:MAG: hypothetical protein ACRDRG_19630 [Pseudonocardiaceae bacterium]